MDDDKLSGRVIIDTILENMRQQEEVLRYSKIVPSAYDVYLHPDDYQRFESLTREIVTEATRGLDEQLASLNRPSRFDKVRAAIHKPRLPYKKVGPWVIRIDRDHDDLVPRGRALVISQIALSGGDSYEGARTKRLATLSREGDEPRASSPAAEPAARAPYAPDVTAASVAPDPESVTTAARAAALATLSWQDESGTHVHRMERREIVIGRDVPESGADVRLRTVPDVSRAHLRIRRDEAGFTVEDLSLLGTTVNGRPIARGSAEPLPARAEIRLADAVTLLFEAEAR